MLLQAPCPFSHFSYVKTKETGRGWNTLVVSFPAGVASLFGEDIFAKTRLCRLAGICFSQNGTKS